MTVEQDLLVVHAHAWTGAGAVMGKGMDDAVYVPLVCSCGDIQLWRLGTGPGVLSGVTKVGLVAERRQ